MRHTFRIWRSGYHRCHDRCILSRVEDGDFLVGCSCTVMRGTVPGVLFLVVKRWVRILACSVALAVRFVEVVTGGARLTL